MELAVILAFLAGVSCSQTPAATQESAPSGNALQGVWRMEEIETTDSDGNPNNFQAQPGQFIFTNSHYSVVFVPSEAPRTPPTKRWEPTAEEMVAEHRSIIVNSGTYELSGTQVTLRPVIAKAPEFVGGFEKLEYQVDGDRLSFTPIELVSVDGVAATLNRQTLRLRRVE